VVFGDFRREEAFRVGQFLPTADQQANFFIRETVKTLYHVQWRLYMREKVEELVARISGVRKAAMRLRGFRIQRMSTFWLKSHYQVY
jgi:hypothetical protein